MYVPNPDNEDAIDMNEWLKYVKTNPIVQREVVCTFMTLTFPVIVLSLWNKIKIVDDVFEPMS